MLLSKYIVIITVNIDNNILEKYGPYLDLVDGSNDVLVDKWVERIDTSGGT